MDLKLLIKDMVENQAMDIFIVTGRKLSCKVHRNIKTWSESPLSPAQSEEMVRELYKLANRDITHLLEQGDDDFSFALKGVSRFRVNTYKQRGTFAAVIRIVSFEMPDPEKLSIPTEILNLSDQYGGLVLVTGVAGSGKTTTLACILDQINKRKNYHIISLEDPIEYLHSHQNSIVSQREISIDTKNYVSALRAALRQSPDVILIGELRDMETISTALTAAETGHYIFSALHTLGAANAIDRLVDAYPSSQQHQIRMQLSMVLRTIVSQQLIPTVDGKVVPAFEIMHCNSAIRTLIRDGRTHQITSIIQSSADEGMLSMDKSILNLFKEGRITKETALTYSLSEQLLERQIDKMGN